RTTTTTISPLTGNAVIGGTATFTITVQDTTTAGTVSTPAGTISFTDTSGQANPDTFTTCTLTQATNPVGTASCQVTVNVSAPAGTHTISAAFTPTDSVHANSTSSAAGLSVNKAATTTSLASSLNPSFFGQSVSL